MIVMAIVLLIIVMTVATPLWVGDTERYVDRSRIVAEQMVAYHSAASLRCASGCPTGPVALGGWLPPEMREADGSLRIGRESGTLASYKTAQGYIVTYHVPFDGDAVANLTTSLKELSDGRSRFHYGEIGSGGVVDVKRIRRLYSTNTGAPLATEYAAPSTLESVPIGTVPGVPAGTAVVASENGL